MKEPNPRAISFWDASATEKNHASITAAFFVHWPTLKAFSHTGRALTISDIAAIPLRQSRRPNRSLNTIFKVSVAIEPDIFDTPALRSVNTIGISFSFIPRCAMR